MAMLVLELKIHPMSANHLDLLIIVKLKWNSLRVGQQLWIKN